MVRARRGQRGQASVEYALVLLAFLGTAIALCALWHAAQAGTLQRRARAHVSHSLEGGVTVELMQDLTAY